MLLVSEMIPPLGHADSNLDKICDNCGDGLVVMVQSQNNSVSYHTKITKAWKSIPNDGTETKVTLLNDIVFSGDDECSAGLVINQKQNVVLYGGDYSITYEGWCDCIDNKGTLTIQSGTISANLNTVSTSGTTIINGGKITSGPYGSALFNNGVLIINGADTRIENQTECVLNSGKLIINDGVIVGKNAGIINAGEMEIHNGDIFASVDANGIGIVFDRGSIVIDGGSVHGAVSIESLYMSDDGWVILSDSPEIAGEKNGIRLTNTIKLSISDKLLSTVPFFMEEYSDGYVVAGGTNGYSITEADAAKLIPADDEYRCFLENGSVVLRKHVHKYTSDVTMPTCTEEGYTTYSCNCGDTYTDDCVNALGHDTVNHEAQAPICTEKGWDAYVTCTRCDYTTYVEKGALGHSYVEPVFAWAEDLSFVSASMPCESCDHIAVSKTTDISWVIGQGKLTAFVAVAMNGKAYTSITEIASAVSGNEIMVTLPDNVRNMVIFAASYSDNGALCTCTSAPVIDGTATLSISGSNVKLFFLNTNGYRPLTPYMTIKK